MGGGEREERWMRREISLQAGVVEGREKGKRARRRGGLKSLEDCCSVAAARGVW